MFFLTLFAGVLFVGYAHGQGKLKNIPLPKAISGVNEEYSGMAIWRGRLYLEPQYGDHKETKLNGEFNIYSILTDSISRVLDGRDTALSRYRTIRVNNLGKLPDSVKQYFEGFEAISIVNNQVFLSIETTDIYDYCFIIKGMLDTVKSTITIDPVNFVSLKRYPYIGNAGFEAVTYLPNENKLLAYYEFNGTPNGGTAYLIDTAFAKPAKQIKAPFLHFRITDIAATKSGQLFGINYYWSGDYDKYLSNNIMRHQEGAISTAVPDLADSIKANPAYLKNVKTTNARIVTMKNHKGKKWEQVKAFEGYKDNWEGMVLFGKGALIITDANRSAIQVTRFAYIEF